MPTITKSVAFVGTIAILPMLLLVMIYAGIQEWLQTPPRARGLKEAGLRRGRIGNVPR